MIDTAQIMDRIGKLDLLSMLAAIVKAVIRFFRSYMEEEIQHYIVLSQVRPYFKCLKARKSVVNRIVHDCRDTVFPRNPDSRCGAIREMKTSVSGYKGIQRGLLKDTH